MTVHLLGNFFSPKIHVCFILKNGAGSMSLLLISYWISKQHTLSRTLLVKFQLLMLMLNFPESPGQAPSLFSVLDEDSRTPASPGHTAGALLPKSGLPLMNISAELHAAPAWELVFSWRERLCICFLIPEKPTLYMSAKHATLQY